MGHHRKGPRGSPQLVPNYRRAGKLKTSDHRVAGSSPAGCKSISRADGLAIKIPEKQRAKTLVIGLLSGFLILLDSRACHMRIRPPKFSG